MNRTDYFSLEPIAEKDPDASWRSRLCYRGERLPAVIEGVILEAQFALQDGRHLLFVTDDRPFEERLQILLLDADFDVQDALELGAPYTSGYLKQVEINGEDRVGFVFAEQGHYEVTVQCEPYRPRPFRQIPNVRRSGNPFRRRYLSLIRLPTTSA